MLCRPSLATAAEKLDSIKSDAASVTYEKDALSEELGAVAKKAAIAEEKIRELSGSNNRIEIELMKTRFVNRFVFAPLLLAVVSVAIIASTGDSFELAGFRRVMAAGLAFSLPVLITCWAIRIFPRLWTGLESWWLPKAMKWAGWASVGLVILTLEAVFQGHVYDKFKAVAGSDVSSEAQTNGK